MNREDTKKPIEGIPSEIEAVATTVVDACFRVHSTLGPGLLESVYEICLVHELAKRGIHTERQVQVPVLYDSIRIDAGLRMDLLVGECLVVELKTVERLLPIHFAQLLTYLKLSGHRLGLLVNFNSTVIKDGIRRMVL